MIYKKKTNRLIFFIGSLLLLSLACFFLLKNIRNNIVFFYTPTEISTSNVNKNQILRIGGLVKPGSVITKEKKYTVITSFIITDCSHDIKVIFDQALPNLFREKQGVVALGKFNKDNLFIASELLTKHSEVYTPPTSTKDNNQETYCKK